MDARPLDPSPVPAYLATETFSEGEAQASVSHESTPAISTISATHDEILLADTAVSALSARLSEPRQALRQRFGAVSVKARRRLATVGHTTGRLLVQQVAYPRWFPQRWQVPWVAYGVAMMAMMAAATVMTLLSLALPDLILVSAPLFLVITWIALWFGPGPSLVSVAVGTLLVDWAVYRPHFTWIHENPVHAAGLLLFALTGASISVLASRAVRAQAQAGTLADTLTAEHARLEALFEAAPVALTVHDAHGRFVAQNRDVTEIVGLPLHGRSMVETAAQYTFRSPDGNVVAVQDLPVLRALSGEAQRDMELVYEPIPGQERVVRVNAAPFYGPEGDLLGVVAASMDLTALRQAERDAEARMDAFLSVASHELKTPLTSLLANVQLLRRRLGLLATTLSAEPTPGTITATGMPDTFDASTVRTQIAAAEQMLAKAEQQARRQDRLINDLLDVSRLRTGKLRLIIGPCDLVEVVRESLEEQRRTQPDRDIRLHEELPTGAPSLLVEADVDRVGQVLTNFLTNALKYAPATSVVDVTVTVTTEQDAEEHTWARVAVRDEGPGLPREELPHVWERFHRVPGVEVQQGSGVGLGLGLYISRELITRQGGCVGVESVVGAGATFWFALPLSRQDP